MLYGIVNFHTCHTIRPCRVDPSLDTNLVGRRTIERDCNIMKYVHYK